MPSPPTVFNTNETVVALQASHETPVLEKGVWPSSKKIWLHPGTLMGYALAYTCILASVLSLYLYSRSNNGVSTQTPSTRYLWKYGPTIVLVLGAALWHQTDTACRTSLPWSEIARARLSQASTSMLKQTDSDEALKANETGQLRASMRLDYVSPIALVVLYQSAKRSHWIVTLTCLGSLVLNLAISFSTGLLVLSPANFTDLEVRIPLNTTFSSRTLNSSYLEVAVNNYYGIQNQHLAYPLGTTDNLAFDVVDMESIAVADATSDTVVDALLPEFVCEVAVASNISLAGDSQSDYQLSTVLTSDSCTTSQGLAAIPDPFNTILPARYIVPFVKALTCDRGSRWQEGTTWLLSLVDTRFIQSISKSLNATALTSEGKGFNVTAWSVDSVDIPSVYCRTSHRMGRAHLVIDTRQSHGAEAINVTSVVRQASSLDRLTESSLSAVLGTILVNGVTTGFDSYSPVPGVFQDAGNAYEVYFKLMSAREGGTSLLKFLNSTQLKKSAEDVYAGIMSQVAHEALVRPFQHTAKGTRSSVEDRLEVKALPVYVLGACCVTLVTLTFLILYMRTKLKWLEQVETVAGYATMLARQSDLSSSPIRIEVDGQYSNDKWWTPFSATRLFMCGAVVLPLSLICALEILQHKSSSLNGIVDSLRMAVWANELSTIVPAAVMMLTAALFQSVFFTISVFSPFSGMITRPRRAEESLFCSVSAQLPLVSLITGLRRRQLGLVLAAVGMSLGSFLTVVVAALYTIEPYNATSETVAKAVDTFNLSWVADMNDGFLDNSAGAVLGLVEHQNGSYPPFTYDGLVFPRSSVYLTEAQAATNISKISIELPALRASLICDFVPSEAVSFQYFTGVIESKPDYIIGFSANVTLPRQCGIDVPYRLGGEITYTEGTEGFGSAVLDPLWVDQATNNRETNSTCYTLGFAFGYFKVNDTSTSNVTMMTCYQNIEEVQTLTTFLYPSMQVDTSSLPVTQENTTRIVHPNALYHISDYFTKNLPLFNASFFDVTSGSAWASTNPLGTHVYGYEHLDTFYQTVISGTLGVPGAELLGEENRGRLLDATQALYRKYMAQLIHANMRQKYSADGNLEPMPTTASMPALTTASSAVTLIGRAATLTSPPGILPTPPNHIAPPTFRVTTYHQSEKLIQNNASKIALQVMLSLMLMLAVGAYALTPTRRVLPHNPCTIVGIMGLLDGSRLCRDILSEHDEQITACRSLLEGHKFRLGWWKESADTRTKDGLPKAAITTMRYGIDVELNHEEVDPNEACESHM